MKNRSPNLTRWLLCVTVAWGLFPAALQSAEPAKPSWLGPAAVAASADGQRLFVALADAHQVAVVDAARGAVTAKIDLPGEPTALVRDPKSDRLYVTCGGPAGVVAVIDPATRKVLKSLPVGHTPTSAVLSPDGSRLFVCNRFDRSVSVLALPEGKPLATVPVSREPVGAAITPDGKTVWVIHLVPDDPANGDNTAAVVMALDAESLRTSEVRLPNGSSSVRGISASPDGKLLFITHVLSRNAMPTTQLERGWMNTNAVSIVDTQAKKLVGTVLLDEVDRGAANPWGVACSADGKLLAVTLSGTHELALLDVPATLEKLKSRLESVRTTTTVAVPPPPKPTYDRAWSWDVSVVSMPLDPANDLSFLAGLRRRVALPGNGPRGLAIVGGKAYVALYFSDALAVVDLADPTASRVATISLGPAPQLTEARRGEMLFHDAKLCFQQWQSCATCHPDARVDGLNWDLMNDGYGNPKNTKSMLLAHRTPPAMSEGVRESAEMAVRAGFRNIDFHECSEEDARAVDVYLKSLQAVPSPHLVHGALSPAAERGKRLFFSARVGCAECHPTLLFTDLKQHDVGSRAPTDHGDLFDTPSLVEAWRTAPYLHDGRYRTIQELLREGKHGLPDGAAGKLTEQELADLVEYVLSL